MALKDIFSDLKETMNDRLRNPFIISFIISWLSSNWLPIYEVFTFGSNYPLEGRTKIISDYVKVHKWDNLTVTPLWRSFVLALLYILCSAFFVALFNFYNTTIKAFINEFTSPGDNVPKDTHKYLENKFENEVKKNTKYRDENGKLAKTINDLNTEKNTINEQLQRVTLNSVQFSTEKEQAISRIENLEKEVDKLVILKKTANAKFESLFIKTKTYRLSFNHKFGNTQLDGSLADLPDVLKGATNIKFDGVDHIRSTTSNDILFSIKDIKLTDDERLLGFNLTNYHNTIENIQFYLIRLGQIEQIGFAIFNGRAFHVTFKINEKLVQQ